MKFFQDVSAGRAHAGFGVEFQGHHVVQVAKSFHLSSSLAHPKAATNQVTARPVPRPQGSDAELNKPTYPALLGLAAAKQKADELHERAMTELAGFDARADALRGLSAFIVNRSH